MKNPSKPFEHIYITAFMSKTIKDGEVITFLAADGFSEYLFDPVSSKKFITNNDVMSTLVDFYNGVIKQYNPKIHSKKTTYFVDNEAIFPLFKAMAAGTGTVIFDPEAVDKVFNPIFKSLEGINVEKKK